MHPIKKIIRKLQMRPALERQCARSAIAMRRLLLVALIAMSLSGCILRNMSGVVTTTDLGTFVELTFQDVSVKYCKEEEGEIGGTTETFVECMYSIATEDGFVELTTTAELLSELGLFGLIVDPLILQVPEAASVVTATVDDGNGQQPLEVTETTAFAVQPGVQSNAETGQKFWIIELPETIAANLPAAASTTDAALDFQLSFLLGETIGPGDAFSLKALFAGRVDLGGEQYYVPLLPCTADFAEVPPIFLGLTPSLESFIFNLLFLYQENPNAGCSGEVYDFTDVVVTPLACDADLDSDVDRDDIQAIFGMRNSAANAPDDPLDFDGDGVITVLDARSCVGLCTRPQCTP